MKQFIEDFKAAGWEGKVFPDVKSALQHINITDKMRGVWCQYNGALRRIHPDVCKWHQDNKDPQCKDCIGNESPLVPSPNTSVRPSDVKDSITKSSTYNGHPIGGNVPSDVRSITIIEEQENIRR